jgi:hypothetical protein
MTVDEHIKLTQEMYSKNKEEINVMANSGMFNSIIEGYCRLAFEQVGLSAEDVSFYHLFDLYTAEDARKKAEE